ncbi:ATP-binding cassette domain-containing protein [Halosimplex halobium]|uniref:ATP-binding cassette domain-containing protein n=1 Tax=Halosimplex halobium TaxID=3396618 RepID=UPI003F56F7D0
MSTVDDRAASGERATAEAADTPVVRVEGLSKRYEGVQALDDVDLDIVDNEVLALVGDNGAGKSTLVKSLTGVISPTAGTIYVRDENGELAEQTIEDPSDAQEVGIETVFQDLALSGQHDVASNVYMGREPRQSNLLGRLLRRVDRDRMEEGATEALAEIGFQVDPTAPTAELSGGQQQATAVARALISDPEIVLLDEPTAEVSVEGSEKILELVERLKDQGRTVVFISHNLDEVFEVADRIAVLRDGKLVQVLDNDPSLDRRDVVGLMTGAVQRLDDGTDETADAASEPETAPGSDGSADEAAATETDTERTADEAAATETDTERTADGS